MVILSGECDRKVRVVRVRKRKSNRVYGVDVFAPVSGKRSVHDDGGVESTGRFA